MGDRTLIIITLSVLLAVSVLVVAVSAVLLVYQNKENLWDDVRATTAVIVLLVVFGVLLLFTEGALLYLGCTKRWYDGRKKLNDVPVAVVNNTFEEEIQTETLELTEIEEEPIERAITPVEKTKDDIPEGFREYLSSASFSKGIDWEFIQEEHCIGNPMERGQYIKKEQEDLQRLFEDASKNNFEIKNSHGGKIIVRADFRDTIGFEIGKERRKLYRLQMVFTENFYLKNAYPTRK